MAEEIDQSSFASILAGVQKMRQDYEVNIPPKKPAPQAQTVSQNEARAPNGSDITKTAGTSAQNNTPQAPVESVNTNSSNGQRSNISPHIGPTNTSVITQRPLEPPKVARNLPSPHPQHNFPENSRNSTTSTAPTTLNSIPTTNTLNNTRRAPRNVHSYTQIQVAQSQKGNPLLESPQMKLSPWTYNGQILSDYYINATVQVLFLSLKYHKLRPEYVWRRLEKLRGGTSSTAVEANDDALRVLLVVVDIDSPQEVLRKLSVMCIKNDLTMVVTWSFEEAGTYVASLKANEMARTKVDSSIQGTKKTDYNSNIVHSLTTVRAVNKTDVANLLANFKSFKNIVLQSTHGDGLSGIQGLGDRKVQNLDSTFSEPFIFNKEWN